MNWFFLLALSTFAPLDAIPDAVLDAASVPAPVADVPERAPRQWTWQVMPGTTYDGFSTKQIHDAAKAAFDTWQLQANVKFLEVTRNANIRIRTAYRYKTWATWGAPYLNLSTYKPSVVEFSRMSAVRKFAHIKSAVWGETFLAMGGSDYVHNKGNTAAMIAWVQRVYGKPTPADPLAPVPEIEFLSEPPPSGYWEVRQFSAGLFGRRVVTQEVWVNDDDSANHPSSEDSPPPESQAPSSTTVPVEVTIVPPASCPGGTCRQGGT